MDKDSVSSSDDGFVFVQHEVSSDHDSDEWSRAQATVLSDDAQRIANSEEPPDGVSFGGPKPRSRIIPACTSDLSTISILAHPDHSVGDRKYASEVRATVLLHIIHRTCTNVPLLCAQGNMNTSSSINLLLNMFSNI